MRIRFAAAIRPRALDRASLWPDRCSESKHFTGAPQAELGELAVEVGAEGRGVGAALVRAAEGWACARGLAYLALGTGAANTRARAFYARLGFREEDVRLAKTLRE